jgi:hypothetical protein
LPARRRTSSDSNNGNSRRPATTPEVVRMRWFLWHDDLAEKQIREGTASSQVITHFLKLGSTREQLERRKIGS